MVRLMITRFVEVDDCRRCEMRRITVTGESRCALFEQPLHPGNERCEPCKTAEAKALEAEHER